MTKIYPENFEVKIGFTKIRELLESYCISDLGKEKVNEIRFVDDHNKISRLLEEQDELQRLISKEGYNLPEQGYYDLREDLKSLAAEESWWETEQFIDLRSFLLTTEDVLSFLKKHETSYLVKLYEDLTFPKDLLQALSRIFTEKGEVSDNASPELRKLRRQLDQNQQGIRKTINHVFRNARTNGWIPEGASITIREGRMVIPLLAEAKRRVNGFIHDESATGQTVYLEPAAVLEGNNRQRELEYEERREVIRILKKISSEVYLHKDEIVSLTGFLGIIDFMKAKMKLTDRLNGIKPELVDKPSIKLYQARHPLLIITEHDIVPLSLELNDHTKVILISGPNAGGKSVALKTVALLQFMVQCGLFIPVGEGSVLGIFDQVLLDIGDEQSIENDLSTYSSHLVNMRVMLKEAKDTSLILIDEFGSGTEPQFGGALAESILESLMERSVKGVITTHYANLKSFAEKHEDIENAAMRFDIKKLKPLYQLSIGEPGSSHALEIAKNTGLPKPVIEKAKDILGEELVNYDVALANIQEQLRDLQEREMQMQRKEKETNQKLKEYKELKERLDTQKKAIIDKAKDEAQELVAKANREIEKTIRHIKENKAEKKETKRVRQQLKTFKQQQSSPKNEGKVKDDTPITTGDMVEVSGSNAIGEVANIQGKKAEVIIGSLKSIVPLSRLTKSSKGKLKKQQSAVRRSGAGLTNKVMNFSGTLDIRGKRVEEALPMVDKYLDDALLAGAQEIRILHGKGSGVLKDLVRNHLKGYSSIESYGDEDIERGGAGITVVVFGK